MRLTPIVLAGFLLSPLASCSSAPDSDAANRPPANADAGGGSSGQPGADGGSAVQDDGGETVPDGSVPDPGAPLYGFVGSSDGKIRVYDVDDKTGAWTLKKESAAGSNPSFLAFDPARHLVVATDEDVSAGKVRSLTFDPTSGALTDLGVQSTGGAGTTHVSLDPTKKWAFTANYNGGSMAVLPVDAVGKLGTASDEKASGPKSHWAGTNPSGTHVFVPSLDSDAVIQYTLNGATGKLTANGKVDVPAGAGPRHLAFHPNEKWAYVINEVASSVTSFAFDKATGKLTAKGTISVLPPGQTTTGVTAAEIFVHPGGKLVYASTRGYDSIVQLSIEADGTLMRAANVTTGGDQPRSFAMNPSGTMLFAGNQDENQVVGFSIDPNTGTLTPKGKVVDVTGPTFVGLSRM